MSTYGWITDVGPKSYAISGVTYLFDWQAFGQNYNAIGFWIYNATGGSVTVTVEVSQDALHIESGVTSDNPGLPQPLTLSAGQSDTIMLGEPVMWDWYRVSVSGNGTITAGVKGIRRRLNP